MNLIVMENLFYDRRFSKVRQLYYYCLRMVTKLWCKIYDLKGSTRNRHVKSTGRENEVLLDENLVQGESEFCQSRCHTRSHSPGTQTNICSSNALLLT